MANLNNIAALVPTTVGYIDAMDTIRGALQASQSSIWTGFSSNVLGTVNFSNAGGYERVVTQWNGNAFTGFNLTSDQLTASSGVVNLGFANASVISNSSDTFFQASSNNIFNFEKASSKWSTKINGIVKSVVGPASSDFYSEALQNTSVSFSETLNVLSGAFTANYLGLSFRAERLSAGSGLDKATYRIQRASGNGFGGFIEFGQPTFPGGSASPGDVVIGTGESSNNRIPENQLTVMANGRTIVGRGLMDSGSATLQTRTFRAESATFSSQPFILAGSQGPQAVVNGVHAVAILANNPEFPGFVWDQPNRRFQANSNMTLIFTGIGYQISLVAGGTAYIRVFKNGAYASDLGIAYVFGGPITYIPLSATLKVLAGDFIDFRLISVGGNCDMSIQLINACAVA